MKGCLAEIAGSVISQRNIFGKVEVWSLVFRQPLSCAWGKLIALLKIILGGEKECVRGKSGLRGGSTSGVGGADIQV